MPDPGSGERVEAVRRFNRFYTRQIGVLRQRLLDSPFSLPEARVLYELAQRPQATAADIGRDLGLDASYLSRQLGAFELRGLVVRSASPTDARRSLLSLTPAGSAAFADLDGRSRAEIEGLLAGLSPHDQAALVRAMGCIESLLGDRDATAPYLLRPHRPGDMGWVVHRHATLYAAEYGWDDSFEALVAEIVARFIRRYDMRRERCWLAERHGEIVGSVFVVRRSPRVAQLRLLLVEPSARGLGIGGHLVGEAIRFARLCGYRRLTLWTNDNLHGARRLYERAGFRLVASEAHHSFGHDLVGQNWELEL